MNHFANARDAILRKRLGSPVVDDFAVPLVGDDVEYGALKESKERRVEKEGE